MTRQEFEKLVDEFGALCNQEGLTGSENATDAANDLRRRLIAAFEQLEAGLRAIVESYEPLEIHDRMVHSVDSDSIDRAKALLAPVDR